MNKAVFIIFLSFYTLVSGCSHNLVAVNPDASKFKFKWGISSVALFKGYFYLLNDGMIYRVNKATGSLDSAFIYDTKGISLNRLYVKNGKLSAEEYSDGVLKIYVLDVEKYTIKFENYEADKYPGTVVFADKDYIISSICHGEWGGTLFFKNKKTRKIYETECTCAFDVQKQEDGYLVTATLYHMFGSTKIFKIPNPIMLPVFDKSNFLKNQDMKPSHFKIAGRQGRIQIADTSFMGCLSKFTYDRDLHLIVKKEDISRDNYGYKLAICVVKNNQLKLVKEIKSEYFDRLTDYHGSEHQPIIAYENNETLHNTGFMDFSDGKITFYNFPLKK